MFEREVGPGIVLRQFAPPDADLLFAVVEKNREYLREWLPWVDQTRSAAVVRDFILRARAQAADGRGPQAAIWIGDQLAGSVGTHSIDWPNRSCSIGYWLAAERQGQGIMTRCCRSLMDYLFEDLRLHRVEVRCATGNTGSCAIPERLGFRREGVIREAERVNDRWLDLVVWGMLDREWRG